MSNFITYLLNLKDAHKLNSEIIPSPHQSLSSGWNIRWKLNSALSAAFVCIPKVST